MPCTSWPGLDNSRRETRSGEEEIIWLAKIRAGNRRNRAVLEWRRTRRRQSKPSRVRSGWLTFAGTTAPRISSSPDGNGSPAGAAGRWFIPRRAAFSFRHEFRDSAQLSETTDSPRVDVPVVVDWRRISLDFLANRRIVPGRFAELAGRIFLTAGRIIGPDSLLLHD